MKNSKNSTNEMLLWMVFVLQFKEMKKKDADKIVKFMPRFILKYHELCKDKLLYKINFLNYKTKKSVDLYLEEVIYPREAPLNLPNSNGFNLIQEFLFSQRSHPSNPDFRSSILRYCYVPEFSSFCFGLIDKTYPNYYNEIKPKE